MTRFALPLVVVLMLSFAGVPRAQQTDEPPATEQKQTEKGGPDDERAARNAKKRQERRQLKLKEREERRAAIRAKVAECRGQAKEQRLRGDQRRKFVRSCVCAEEIARNVRACAAK